jgi:hypothetical protein
MRPGRGDEGQSTVELALALPLVAVLALLVAQVVVVARAQLLVAHAAREAARSAAVADRDPRAAALDGARRAGGLDPRHLEVVVSNDGRRVVAEVRYRAPTDVAVVGPLLPSPTLRARVAMWDEGSLTP